MVVADNNQLDETTFSAYESNFCHPVVIDDWDVEAPACL